MDLENTPPPLPAQVVETAQLLEAFDRASTKVVGYLDEGYYMNIPEDLKEEILEETERCTILSERLKEHFESEMYAPERNMLEERRLYNEQRLSQTRQAILDRVYK